jgi:hypothetical protein
VCASVWIAEKIRSKQQPKYVSKQRQLLNENLFCSYSTPFILIWVCDEVLIQPLIFINLIFLIPPKSLSVHIDQIHIYVYGSRKIKFRLFHCVNFNINVWWLPHIRCVQEQLIFFFFWENWQLN